MSGSELPENLEIINSDRLQELLDEIICLFYDDALSDTKISISNFKGKFGVKFTYKLDISPGHRGSWVTTAKMISKKSIEIKD